MMSLKKKNNLKNYEVCIFNKNILFYNYLNCVKKYFQKR